jgi:hypothetical protein
MCHAVIALAFGCDLQHYLTFPQLCRETIAFSRVPGKIFLPLPYALIQRLFDICPAMYVYIVFPGLWLYLIMNKLRTSGAAEQGATYNTLGRLP